MSARKSLVFGHVEQLQEAEKLVGYVIHAAEEDKDADVLLAAQHVKAGIVTTRAKLLSSLADLDTAAAAKMHEMLAEARAAAK